MKYKLFDLIFVGLFVFIFLSVSLVVILDFSSANDEVEEQFILEQIAINESEKVYVEDWNCLDYSKYYNKTFTEKYPELDVRWIRMVDICNNDTYCETLHTYIIINGYGGTCILDQHQIACTNILQYDIP